MNNIYEIKCFIASPGDTAEERQACENVFEEINHGIGRSLGFCLVSIRWEKDIYPSVAEYGQQVINQLTLLMKNSKKKKLIMSSSISGYQTNHLMNLILTSSRR